jgi:hypothetical protein
MDAVKNSASSPVSTAASVGVSSDSIWLATLPAEAASIPSRSLSSLARAAVWSDRNSFMSSTFSWPIPAK